MRKLSKTSKTSKVVKFGLLPLLSAAFMVNLVAVNAQPAIMPKPQKSIKPGKPDIVMTCCRCIGGKNDAVNNISTGVASWTVSSTPTPPPPMPAGGWQAGPIAVVPTNWSAQVAPINIGANPLPGIWTNAVGASWLKPSGPLPNGHWTYVLKVQVPNCTIPQKVMIAGQLAADDYARMYVDGPTGTTTLIDTPGAGFSTSAIRNFSAALDPDGDGITQPGNYFIRVEMDNLGGAPAGIVLKGALNGECSDKLTRDRNKGERETAGDCPTC